MNLSSVTNLQSLILLLILGLERANVSIDGLSNLKAWFDRIDSRKATQRALEIPQPRWAFFGKGDIRSQESENAENFQSDVKSVLNGNK